MCCGDVSPSVLTPYYLEEVLFSLCELEVQNEDGVSILFYLQKIFPDEWNNFLERVKHDNEEEFKGSNELEEDKLEKLRLWASYRGQTLTRTIRGMMYYRKALELQAFLDMAKDEDLIEGYKAVELNMEDQIKGERSLWAQCQAVADMKFTYVVSCQRYGIGKQSGNPRAQDILRLMTTYPSLHVAYIDEVEEPSKDASKKINQKVYYYELVKAALPKSANSSVAVQNLDQLVIPGVYETRPKYTLNKLPLHLLDIVRQILEPATPEVHNHEEHNPQLPTHSVTRLRGTGIRLRKKNSLKITDIDFDKGRESS
ncbi:Callose synthase 3 [Camellia lanceoleosa]|uniref:Callose synthase 3 n=1 Tax=Camellia lanceoleosa TaxID=1840588 RepID=A0ACC0F7Z1_9ERIC|nr:Callose synthase 3 [Camellia lanceoleosa]